MAGLSVLSPMYTPPIVEFLMERKNTLFTHADFSSSLHELLSTHEPQIRVLPAVCASTDKNGAVFPHAGPPLSVPFLAGSDCFTTHMYSFVWGAQGELRAVLLHPRLTVKVHSCFWLSHRLFGWFFPAVSCAH